jgi:radical SAM superfamily enzyme YgiQ (UPF0313 family)
VEQSIEEVSAVVKAGTRRILLRDQVLPIEDGTLEAFCRGIQKANLNVEWLCEARLGSLDRSMLALMRGAGCVRIHYGVETGDSVTFETEAKRGVDSKSVRSSFAETQEAGITPSAHFLVGFLGDDWTSIGKTISLIREVGIADGDCSILTPYPGTKYFSELVAEGRLTPDTWDDFTGTNPVLKLDALSPVELIVARRCILNTLSANAPKSMRHRLSAAVQALKGSEPENDVSTFLAEQGRRSSSEPMVTPAAAGGGSA